MDLPRWEKIQALFDEAVGLEGAARAAFLDRIRETDAEAHAELAALLEADEQNSVFAGDLRIEACDVEPAPLDEGPEVGPYRIEKTIGRGAMGVVYKAADTRLERNVALKFLSGSHAATSRARARFFAEAKAVSRLDHPNICTLFDIGETDQGRLYIAMAYYEGATLNRRLRESPAPLADVVDWVRQIGDGLRYAHERGVVHRDLKAANVLLDPDDRVKILDFGVAKLQGVDITDTGLRVGTVAYMSPEQLVGAEVDPRTDIWSLGVLLYELVTGERPFRAESSSVLANQILRGSVVPPSARIPWLPAILDRIVGRCLVRDLNGRYPDMGAMLEDVGLLANVLAADPGLGRRMVGPSLGPGEPRSDLTHFSELEARHITAVSCGFELDPSAAPAARGLLAELSLSLQQRAEAYALSEGIAYFHTLDGLITLCFGYPLSREDNPIRAVQAAIALGRLLREHVEALPDVDPGIDPGRCSIRLGIHTGDVVVDGTGTTMTGLIQRMQGDAHLVANRLRSLGEDGDIVVSETTAGLLKGSFRLVPVGALPADAGFGEVAAHKVLHDEAEDRAGGDFWWHADHSLIGRRSECAILREAWDSVGDGDGRVVAIKGEAGIGKSRLLQWAVRQLGAAGANTTLLQCTIFRKNTFMYPLKQWLRAELAGEPGRTSGIDRGSLAAYLADAGIDDERSLNRLAGLFDLPAEGAAIADPSSATPEIVREQTIQVFVDIVGRRAGRRPQLILAEDLHWADAATLEFFQRLIDQGGRVPFLLLMSFRPEFEAAWLNRSHIVQLSLGKLGKTQSRALARDRIRSDYVPEELIDRIVERSDGVPLFIEELCSTVRDDLPKAGESGGGGVSPTAAREIQIPETLRDSLAARLDRRIEFRPIAQLGAVIGRSFDYALIQKVWTGETATLDAGLQYLVRSELMFQSGVIPDASFLFKHALLQDAAYESLVDTRRAAYHRLVADAIERHFPAVAEREPEVLAEHRSRSHEPSMAAPLWLAAAKEALRRSALVDTITYARRGLDDVGELAGGPQALGLELELLMAQGPALMAHYSWSARAVQDTYERAREICASLGNPPALFPVLYGLYTYHCVVGNHREGQSLNAECLDVADTSGDDGLLLEATMLKGMTHFFFGELEPALEHLSVASAAYDAGRFGDHCYLYGQDPGMVTNSYLALALAMTGEPEAARALSARSLEATRALDHPFSLTYGLSFAAWLALELNDTERGRELAEEAQALSKEHRTAIMLGMSRVLIGWARLQRGDATQALADIVDGIGQFEALGAGVLMPFWHGLEALAEHASGDPAAALASIEAALSFANRTEEHWSTPELYRFRSGILEDVGDAAAAFDDLRLAADIAGKQAASTFEQRARSRLARVTR